MDMPKGAKMVVLEPDVYKKLRDLKDTQGIEIQFKANDLLRKGLGIKEE